MLFAPPSFSTRGDDAAEAPSPADPTSSSAIPAPTAIVLARPGPINPSRLASDGRDKPNQTAARPGQTDRPDRDYPLANVHPSDRPRKTTTALRNHVQSGRDREAPQRDRRSHQSRGGDSNPRPPLYESGAL